MSPAAKVERYLADLLGRDLVAAPKRDVEIGQHDLARRPGIAAQTRSL